MTLSRAFQQRSCEVQNWSSKKSSEVTPTPFSKASICSSGFQPLTTLAAVVLLGFPTSVCRKRNWRLRLETSILSMSVTISLPPGPLQAPISERPLRYSQPSAPQPTKKSRCFLMLSMKLGPMTAAWYAYRVPAYSPKLAPACTRLASSWCTHCSMGRYFPVFLMTSCATAPPRKAQNPVSSASISMLKRLNLASKAGMSSTGSPLGKPNSTFWSQQAPSFAFCSSLRALARSAISCASLSSRRPGKRPLASLKRKAAARASCTQHPAPSCHASWSII
mmetsp:Transcript_121464/g.288657  ORF Transcript_121464/g.288657 Transcript_121464/m.288657 type:complete len:278 (-) Transcript_121464:1223-2056(-)